MRRTLISVGAVVLMGTAAGAQERGSVQPRKVELDRQAVEAVKAARVPIEGSLIKGAPYSAEVVNESVQVLGDGNRIVRKTTGRVYRDSQGRIRREQDIEPGHVGTISISDPVAKVTYSLDADRKTGWKTGSAVAGAIGWAIAPTPADPAAVEIRKAVEAEIVAFKAEVKMKKVSPDGPPPLPSPSPTPAILPMGHASPGWDEKTEKLPARNIEGVMAEGVRTTRTIPAGAIGNEQPIVTVTEEWRSPDLRVLVLTRTSDPRTGESTYKLLNITRAEPAQSWFDVPPDYTIKESGIKKLAPVMK